jgi:hypothetical protein
MTTDTRDRIAWAASKLWPTLRRSVPPIAVIREKQTLQWGTGTFFRVAEDSFLVTASHVWEEVVRRGFESDLHVFVSDRPEEAGGVGSGRLIRHG